MILAAIDIGSNAARLLFANVYETEDQKVFVEKATLVRIPTRLGEDVYTNNRISEEKAENLIKTLLAFKLLIEVYNPIEFDACGTAAMREAENGEDILKRIHREVGFDIRVIDGEEEANIIRHTHKIGFENNKDFSIYIDVGGGSTDISVSKNGNILEVKSFKIGALRLLKNKVKKKEWDRLKKWLKTYKDQFGKLHVIGSGGNINKINKLFGDQATFTLTMDNLKQAYKYLDHFTLEERIEKMGLRPDRADVILPAAEIFLFIMKIVKANEIIVPKIGLADGLVFQLFEKYRKSKK